MPRSAPSGDQLPLQQAVIDQRRLLTVPWVGFLQRLYDLASSKLYVEGTHLDRVGDGTPENPGTPAGQPGTKNGPGTFFYETDRTVLYQSRLVKDPALPSTDPPIPAWVYVLGTMQGTLSPDQRPTDLGWKPANKTVDTGFQFEATDTGQNFVWDGTAWIDVSRYPYATYGPHADRLVADGIADGGLWLETDRRNALYQLRAGEWWYLAGTMYGTMAPDQRPADLGDHDGGFEFRTTDLPARHFIWSQVAWTEITAQGNTIQMAYADSSLTLTTSAQNIPGCSLTLANAGQYLITGNFDLQSYDANVYLAGGLNGSAPYAVILTSEIGFRVTIAQQWVITVGAGFVAQLHAFKTSGTGTSQIVGGNTSITAIRIA